MFLSSELSKLILTYNAHCIDQTYNRLYIYFVHSSETMPSAISRILRQLWLQRPRQLLNIRSFPQQTRQGLVQQNQNKNLPSHLSPELLKAYTSQTRHLRRVPHAQKHLEIPSRQTHQISRPVPEYGEKEGAETPYPQEDSFDDLDLEPEPSALQMDLPKVKYGFVFFLVFCAGAYSYLHMNYPANTGEESRAKEGSGVGSRTGSQGVQEREVNVDVELEILGHSIWVTR